MRKKRFTFGFDKTASGQPRRRRRRRLSPYYIARRRLYTNGILNKAREILPES